MKVFIVGLAVALGLAGPVLTRSAAAQAIASDNIRTFAVLPEGLRFPEGITANPSNGDIYVGTFDFGPNVNALLRYDSHGRLLGQRYFGAAPLLGVAFGPRDGKVYIANFGTFRIQRVAADLSGPIEDVAILPGIGAPAPRNVPNPDGSSDTILFGSSSRPAPNGLVFGAAGELYVSDSFQGAIFRIGSAHTCSPCVPSLVVHHERLMTAGFPPFGANGLALSRDGNALFIANTGDDRVLKLDLMSLQISDFAESVNGADGLAMDEDGRLWVAANQGDHLVALDERGRVVAQIGSFEGLRHGQPEGFLFPASVLIVGREAFVTNLALPLTPAVGDEPEEDVTRWTISRVRLHQRR